LLILAASLAALDEAFLVSSCSLSWSFWANNLRAFFIVAGDMVKAPLLFVKVDRT
jgi:hypothetical protein